MPQAENVARVETGEETLQIRLAAAGVLVAGVEPNGELVLGIADDVGGSELLAGLQNRSNEPERVLVDVVDVLEQFLGGDDVAGLQADVAADQVLAEPLEALDSDLTHPRLDDQELDHALGDLLLRDEHVDDRAVLPTVLQDGVSNHLADQPHCDRLAQVGLNDRAEFVGIQEREVFDLDPRNVRAFLDHVPRHGHKSDPQQGIEQNGLVVRFLDAAFGKASGAARFSGCCGTVARLKSSGRTIRPGGAAAEAVTHAPARTPQRISTKQLGLRIRTAMERLLVRAI